MDDEVGHERLSGLGKRRAGILRAGGGRRRETFFRAVPEFLRRAAGARHAGGWRGAPSRGRRAHGQSRSRFRTDRAAAMPHVVLLGDSIFDNRAYVDGGPDVVAQLRAALPAGWSATLAAVDGTQAGELAPQLARLPADATHLVLSVGGNDALLASGLLDEPVYSSADALRLIAAVLRDFERAYAAAVDACRAHGLPLVLCTIYGGNFPEADFRERAGVALAVFNDAIVRCGLARGLDVIDLRAVCNEPRDYANPIEPSVAGGAKIARAVARAVADPAVRGTRLLAG